MQSGNTQQAKNLCFQQVSRRPENAYGWYLYCEYLLSTGNVVQALECSKKAGQLAKNECSPLVQLAKCYLFLKDFANAFEYAKKAADLEPTGMKDLDTLGNIFSHCHRQELALNMFEKAIQLEPDNSDLLYNLATSYRFLGDTQKADQAFSTAIKLNPLDFQAVQGRSLLKKQHETENHIDELKENIAHINMNTDCRVSYYYSLAKELEDLERYESSFSYLKMGADLKHDTLKYDLGNDLANIDAIINTFSKSKLATAKTGFDDDRPIFVMGLPRTGTTLLERILSSHSEIASAGELVAFPRELEKSFSFQQNPISPAKQGFFSHSLDIDFDSLGKRYLQRALTRVHARHYFVDKLPFNFLNIGYIHQALPNAKLILMVRNPMDSCYSIYKSLFNRGYSFSYDLESIARFYVSFRKLIDHWNAVLGQSFLTVRYEDLVTGPRQNIEKILQYCGLEWQDNCLDFYKNADASTTASASQVRQPMYTSSIGNWKNYRLQLDTVEKILTANRISLE